MNFRMGAIERTALRIREMIEHSHRSQSELHFKIDSRAEYLRTVEMLEEKWDRQDRELNMELMLADKPRRPRRRRATLESIARRQSA